MVNNKTLFDLIDLLQITEHWLDAGNAHKTLSVANAITEFDSVAEELAQITTQPAHSLFTVADIRAVYNRLTRVSEELKALPLL